MMSGVGVPVVLFQLSICLKLGNIHLILKQQDPGLYEKLNYQWNTFNYIEPLAYILPKNTAQVRQTVKCTRALNIHVTIKSGGHSYAKYCFGDNSSVVIDLSMMTFLEVNKNSSTVTVGPGVLIGPLFYNVWKQGNFVAVGCNGMSVGVGGAVQGGGYCWLSQKFGLMVDNLLEMKVVTAKGDLLKVNFNHHDDLFWALRGGGGGNFGIVTTIKMKIHSAATFEYNLVVLNYRFADTVPVYDTFQKTCSQRARESTFFVFSAVPSGISITIIGISLSKAELNLIIGAFPVPISKDVQLLPDYPSLVIQLPFGVNITKVPELNQYDLLQTPSSYVKLASYFTTKLITRSAISKLANVLALISNFKAEVYMFSFSGLTSTIPKDATAFVHRNAIYSTEVKLLSGDDKTMLWANNLKESLLVLDNGESYQNHVDGSLPDYLQRYYGSNLERLRRIKRKYDPDNYFRFPQFIPPSE